MIVTTKIGQASHMGKHEAAVAMLRMAKDMREALEELGSFSPSDVTAFDNVFYTFLATLPAKVAEEIKHG